MMRSDKTRLAGELQESFDRNVFIMMRYRPGAQFKAIEEALKNSLAEYGLMARFAKDRAFLDDLWDNIQLYMKFSRLGIAVFEEIDEREFNPNISLELGYMYALGRRCLIIKDKRMPRLPTDTCGKLYRDFDTYNLPVSIEDQIRHWCEQDLGLFIIGATGEQHRETGTLIYDSKSEDNEFRTWGVYSSIGRFYDNITLIDGNESDNGLGDSKAFLITARSTEGAGVNKAVATLCGRAKCDYKAIDSRSSILNMYLCMIPMQGEESGLIEVGAAVRADPGNAYSPYRVRYYIPHEHIGDGDWHQAEIVFDFRKTPTTSYSIFAARINEGCPKPGPGSLLITNVQIISYESR